MIERSELSAEEGASPRDPSAQRALRLHRFRVALRRYWWVIALTILLGLGVQGYRCYTQSARYMSTSRMMVSGRVQLPQQQVYSEEGDASSFYGTQIALMKSPETVTQAIDRVSTIYPDVKVEVTVDYGLTDVAAERYDLGVRNGDQVEKDMVAVRIGPDRRMVIVGAPSYLAQRPKPSQPQDLLHHNCLALRFPSGGLYAWELKKGKKAVQVRAEGQAIFNGSYLILNAALSGCGLAFIPEDMAAPHVAAGQLHHVMEDWCPTFPGLHVYFASRRQRSRAVELIVESLRFPQSPRLQISA